MKLLNLLTIRKCSLLILCMLSTQFAVSQVGINTELPKSTLDVNATKNSLTGNIDVAQHHGLQAPRLTRAQLTASTVLYTDDQIGALIYITNVQDGDQMDARRNIDSIGYYYFDGQYWQKLTGGSGGSGVSISAANGLNLAGDSISLGGTLSSKTNINTSSYNLSFSGSGNIGIGTQSPDSKLHIVSSTANSGFKLQDGTQADSLVLTSDANGNASWKKLSAISNSAKATIQGSISTSTQTQRVGSYKSILGTNITLTKGTWLVYIGQMITANQPSDSNNNIWVRFTLTNGTDVNATTVSNLTQNGFNMPATSPTTGGVRRALVSTSTSAMKTESVYYSFANGVILVNVTDPSVLIYLAFEVCIFTGNFTAGSSTYYATVGNNRENYFFAVPIN